MIRRLQRLAFRVLSRTARTVYGWFPVFGAIRGAIAIIPIGDGFVAIDRADGLGLGLPGGIIGPNESAESCIRREIREETGLEPVTVERLFEQEFNLQFPVHRTVFFAITRGTLRDSWEGTPRIVSISELMESGVVDERGIVQYLEEQLRHRA